MGDIAFTRWVAKKLSRSALAAASSVKQFRRSSHAASLRAITYHRFGPSRRDPFCVDAREFATQMAWLRGEDRAASLDDLGRTVGGSSPDHDRVLVTMDDGDLTVLEHAASSLSQYRIPSVAFVIVSEVGTAGRMSWAQLRELQEVGVEIGSHALTHQSMGRIAPSRAREEMQRSRKTIEDELGVPCRAFAYPFGTLSDFNDETTQLAEEIGYDFAFTSQHGAIRPGAKAWCLPRVKVEGGDPGWVFPMLCSGALDSWRWVDRMMYRIQRPTDETPAAGSI